MTTRRVTFLARVGVIVLASCDANGGTTGEEPSAAPPAAADVHREPEPAEGSEATVDPACADAPADDVSLVLRTAEDASLAAVLCNRTDRAWRYTTRGQSPVLHLERPGGEPVERDNRLARRRRRLVVQERHFTRIAPGEAHELEALDRESTGDGWQLDWYPFRFSPVAQGSYRARVTWTSDRETTTEGEPVEGVWTGSLETDWRRLDLPAPGGAGEP